MIVTRHDKVTANMPESQRHIYIAGRGLSCSLGNNLAASVERMAADALVAGRDEQTSLPFFSITPPAPADHAAWTERARRLIADTVREAGGEAIRHAPLFIASSSLNMGAIERGRERRPDMHAEAEAIAAMLDWQGLVFWISTACTSSINALLSALRLMRSGDCDNALVLGVELANRYTLSGFSAMQLLSSRAALPLGQGRDGLVLGEAVAALRLSTAPARWALLGGGCVVDGKDATGASLSAVVRAWQDSMQDSRLDPASNPVDLLKLQAAGSPMNDGIELDAISEVFNVPPALTTLKALVGHTLGASGAAEIALLTAALDANVFPANNHIEDATLPHRLSQSMPRQPARVLASIIGFGGSHASVLLQDTRRLVDLPVAQDQASPRLWEVCGRSGPRLPPDWREELAGMLGHKPRRIGIWAEVGLYGALQCMRNAGETHLPQGAILRIGSLVGPMGAILQTLRGIDEDGMAMPFTFLQSQPGQLPAILAQALQWQGDARVINHRDVMALLAQACREGGEQGVLIGWLEEADANGPVSHWLRLRPARGESPENFVPANLADLASARYLRLRNTSLELAF
jgi:3-oxoacyl-[acyl-carrier-protein] synthase-1